MGDRACSQAVQLRSERHRRPGDSQMNLPRSSLLAYAATSRDRHAKESSTGHHVLLGTRKDHRHVDRDAAPLEPPRPGLLHPTPHSARRTGRQPDARTPVGWRNHLRSAVSFPRRSATRLTSCPTVIAVPSGSVISILPSGACSVPLADDGSICPARTVCRFPDRLNWQEDRRRFPALKHAAARLAAPVP